MAFLASGFDAPQEDLDNDLEVEGGEDEAVGAMFRPGTCTWPGAIAPNAVEAPGERHSSPGKKDALVRGPVVELTGDDLSDRGRGCPAKAVLDWATHIGHHLDLGGEVGGAGGTADGGGAVGRHGEMKRQAGIAREVVVVVVAMGWGIWVSWSGYLCSGDSLRSFGTKGEVSMKWRGHRWSVLMEGGA